MHLKGEIRANRLPPGLQAPEPDIAKPLGMSRAPVREALVRVEAEGLVELIPRRGARMTAASTADIAELCNLLTAFEPLAVRLDAKRNPTEDEMEPLRLAIENTEAALQSKDLDRWAEADHRIHLAPLVAT